jgi:hypothetical protein
VVEWRGGRVGESQCADAAQKFPAADPCLVEEHRRRRGDPVEGGGSRTPIMTEYRLRALTCAATLAQEPRRPRDLKASIPDAYNTSMAGSSPSSEGYTT